MLPLRSRTPDDWASGVLSEPLLLLNDHAHLEKKAAANALELLVRWPESAPVGTAESWTTAMTAVARDEAEHLAAVTRLLYRRGGAMSKQHANPYAAELRRMVRKGGAGELVDRLLVSALIEVRSCERFEVLGRNCEDGQLARLYRGLWASEHGHYLTFLRLAERVVPPGQVQRRWEDMLDAEAAILASQTPGPRMHSGCRSP